MAFVAAKGMVDLGINVRKFEAQSNRVEGRLTTMESRFVKVGRIARRAFVGISAGMGLAVAMGSQFEQSMQNVRTLLQASDTDFKSLKAAAEEMGKTTVFSASEAADAMGFFALAGFKVNEILSALPSTLALAAAGSVDLATAADIVAKAMRGMGLEAEDTGRIADVLTNAFTTANTDLMQLGEAFKFVAPVARSAGVSLEETTAALAILSDAGIQAAMAGTGLRRILTTLQRSIVIKEFRKMGLEVTDAAGRLKPLADVIGLLQEKFEKLDPLERSRMIEFFGQRAGPALEVLLAKGGAALAKYVQELKTVGTTARIASEKLDTLRGDFRLLTSAMSNVANKITESLNPALRKLTGLITSVTNSVGTLAGDFPVLTGILIAGTVGILGLVASLGLLGNILVFAVKGLAVFNPKIIGLAKSVKKLGFLGLALNPLTAALAAAAVVAVIVGKRFKDLSDEFDDVVESSKAFENIARSISKTGKEIKNTQDLLKAAEGDAAKQAKLRVQLAKDELKQIQNRLERSRQIAAAQRGASVEEIIQILELIMRQRDLEDLAIARVEAESRIAVILREQKEEAERLVEIQKVVDRLKKRGLSIDRELLEQAGTFEAKIKLINLEFEERLKILKKHTEEMEKQALAQGKIGQSKEFSSATKEAKKLTKEIERQQLILEVSKFHGLFGSTEEAEKQLASLQKRLEELNKIIAKGATPAAITKEIEELKKKEEELNKIKLEAANKAERIKLKQEAKDRQRDRREAARKRREERQSIRGFLATKAEQIIIEATANAKRLKSLTTSEKIRRMIQNKTNENIVKRLKSLLPERKKAEFLDLQEPFRRAQLAAAGLGAGKSIQVQGVELSRKQLGKLGEILKSLQTSNLLTTSQTKTVAGLNLGVQTVP